MLSPARSAPPTRIGWQPASNSPLLTLPTIRLQVRGHAVSILERTTDEELQYYLLQLVQALRYEAVDDSRLARFITARAKQGVVLGSLLHWYLYTEWEDAEFGPRAQAVHRHLLAGASSLVGVVSDQIAMMAQLQHIVRELKVGCCSCTVARLALLQDCQASVVC